MPPPAPPADRASLAARAREPGLHAAAVAVTILVVVAGLRLDRADFHAPFSYEHDALLILPFVKEVVETGSHWHAERLGAPGGLDLHDFPVVDHLHLAVIWLLGRAFPDPVVAFNLFYLLTYPLTAVTGLYAFRRLGLAPPTAFALALLYTFQPYHYLRGQVHYFLSAYYVVPLTLVLALEICRGRLPFFPAGAGPTGGAGRRFRPATRAGLGAALVALATASAGAYYAFFSCFFLAAAAVYGWAAARTWRAAASGGLLLALVVAGGLLNHAPAFAYQAAHGQNPRPRERQAEEAELYGLKVAQMILPVAGHNPLALTPDFAVDFAGVRAMYQSPQAKELNEADWAAVGLVAAVGYVGLLVAVCLPGRRAWPVGPLAALTAAGTLVGTLGGFGAVFNLLVSPQVRCYNRVSIFLAFFALAAVGFALDAAGRWLTRRHPAAAALAAPAAVALVVFGVWDQTNDAWFPDVREPRAGSATAEGAREAAARRYAQDADFFGRVEALLPAGQVYTYPFVEYPEARPYHEPGAAGDTHAYDMALGYLHTKRLRWSFGAIKGREWDAWMRRVSGKEPVPRFLERVSVAGFEGLLIDAKGLNPKRWDALQRDLDQYLGGGALREVHRARKLYFYDLRGYRNDLIKAFGPAGFDARTRAEHTSLVTLWPRGFLSFLDAGNEDRLRWCPRHGELALVNRADKPVTVRCRMKFKAAFKGAATLTVSSGLALAAGGVWADELRIGSDDRPPEYDRTVVVPPGRHAVRFTCDPDGVVLPTDSRRLLFTVRDFRAE